MNYWFISDTHFFHKNIIDYSNRPFSTVEEMNETIIKNWNDYVTPTDIVYHLGDFAMGTDFDSIISICGNLNGFIHLVPGNHDTNKKLDIYAKYFTIEPPLLHLRKPDVVLCHYPLAVWNGNHYGFPHLHGHSHGTFFQEGKCLDVGVDVEPKYRPKHWDELKEQLNRIEYTQKDHHAEIIREGIANYTGSSRSR